MHRSLLIIAGVALSLAGGMAWLLGEGAPAPQRFTLVYNVNSGGYVDVCGCEHKEVRQGSLTRRASFIRQLRATGRPILLLDGGSCLFPIADRVKESELPERIRQAELIIEAYNRMGYQAMAIGSFDIAAGIDRLRRLEELAKFPFLSANLVEEASGKPIFRPHMIVEVGGARVGILGLTQATMGSFYLEKVAAGTTVLDPVECAKKSLQELRGKVDLVIALSHLQEESNERLAKELPEIEILVDPCIQLRNHHTWIGTSEWVAFLGETVRLRSDGQGARMGVVDIELAAPRAKLLSRARLEELEALASSGELDEAARKEKASFVGKGLFDFLRISLEPHHGTDPEIDALVTKWKAKEDPATVPPMADPLSRKKEFLTAEGCKDCHVEQYDNWKKTRHAEAFTTLLDSGDEGAFDCIGCHTLGYGQAFLSPADAGDFAHVQCESCHGTKPDHAREPKKFPFGRVSRDACVTCHNKEVLETPFDFLRARAAIACPKG